MVFDSAWGMLASRQDSGDVARLAIRTSEALLLPASRVFTIPVEAGPWRFVDSAAGNGGEEEILFSKRGCR